MKTCSACKKQHDEEFKTCQSCRDKARARRAAKPEVYRALARKASAAHYAKTAVEQRARTKKYRLEHPEWWREVSRRRRAAVLAASTTSFSPEQLRARLSMYPRCWICRTNEWTQVDHVKPLSKGGAHILANLRPACERCNKRKGAKWPFVHRV